MESWRSAETVASDSAQEAQNVSHAATRAHRGLRAARATPLGRGRPGCDVTRRPPRPRRRRRQRQVRQTRLVTALSFCDEAIILTVVWANDGFCLLERRVYFTSRPSPGRGRADAGLQIRKLSGWGKVLEMGAVSSFLLLGPAWVGAQGGGFSLLLRACERKGRVLGAQAHPGLSLPERRLLEVKYERISGPVAPLQQ